MWKRSTCFVLLMLLLGTAAYGAFDPLKDASLIGWWKCDEGQGSVVGDSGPGKHDGTFVVGASAWTTGVSGSAISLSGNTVVEVPALNLKLTQATMAGWVLPNGAQVDWAAIIMHRSGTAGSASGFNLLASRQLAYHWNDDPASWNYRGTAYYAADEWTHCAVTIEPTKATFYINGLATSTNTVNHAVSTWDGPFWFGGDRTYTGSRHFNGALDEITFFSRALTAAEVRDIVTPRPKARKPNPADKASNITMGLLQWTAGDNAIFHDVYLGLTPDLKAADKVASKQPFAMYYHVAGLKPGATYYWRIDEIDATGNVATGDVWSFSVTPAVAWAPAPASGAGFVKTDVTLTWSTGQGALNHDVYVSANKDDVVKGAAGAFKGNQKTASLALTGLTPDTIYYWRVDEVGMTGAKLTGDIWTFNTRPVFAKTDPSLMGWWKMENEGSNSAVDYSGNNRDGALMGNPQWVDGYLGGALQFNGTSSYVDTGYTENLAKWTICAWVTSPAAPGSTSPTGPVHREMNYQLDWNHGTAAFRGAAAMRVGGTWYSATLGTLNGNTWYHLAASYDGKALKSYVNGVLIATTPAPGTPDADTNTLKFGRHASAAQFFAGTVDDVRVYNRDLTVDELKKAMQGDPTLASNPQPAPNANVDIQHATDLSWTAGEKAAKHDVYLGQDAAAVRAAGTSAPEYKGRQTGTTFSLAGLVSMGGGAYFWRIDEVEADGTTIHKGSVWTFTVPAYLLVDEFESYDDIEGSRIFDIWIDGWVNNTGSTVGNTTAPFAERTIVHGGKQAMPMDFNNTKAPFYSEAELDFAPLQNWTGNGVDTLSIWFQGSPVRFVDKGNGAFTVGASGHDIWDAADDFRFVYKQLSGNGSAVVKVDSLANTNAWAKAGVMIRESLTADSAMAYMIISYSSGASFGWRQTTGGTPGSATKTGIAAPQWVKLTRTTNAFTAQYSADGKTWTDIVDANGKPVSTTVLMGANVYIGLCVTSHNTAATTTAQLSGAATTGTVTGQWKDLWIGDDPDRTNGTGKIYAVVEDSAGKSAVVTNADPAATNVAAWTEWKIPLSSLTGVNLAKVKKLFLGVGDRKAPVADGSGRVFFDDIRVTKP